MILFLYGVSAGSANYAPIAALLGSVVLFVLAAPIFVYRQRVGLIVGLAGCLLIVPYNIGFAKSVFDDGFFDWGVLVAILPTLLILFSLFFTAKGLILKNAVVKMPSGLTSKVLLSGIPIVLFLLYLIFYGKYWSWQMFRI
jgi:hypothetical protein